MQKLELKYSGDRTASVRGAYRALVHRRAEIHPGTDVPGLDEDLVTVLLQLARDPLRPLLIAPGIADEEIELLGRAVSVIDTTPEC